MGNGAQLILNFVHIGFVRKVYGRPDRFFVGIASPLCASGRNERMWRLDALDALVSRD